MMMMNVEKVEQRKWLRKKRGMQINNDQGKDDKRARDKKREGKSYKVQMRNGGQMQKEAEDQTGKLWQRKRSKDGVNQREE